jgi:phosphoribosyl-ATP pyrophosphohydrolase/phosphoribosyl-AMP cyclohydrolase
MKEIKFDEKGLVPVVIQDDGSGDVLMVAYMNEEALKRTILEKKTYFFSRSRGRLWLKGETSGNFQKVKGIWYDCDHDTILVRVDQEGVACHTGEWTCFHNLLYEEKGARRKGEGVISELFQVVDERRRNPKEDSYTSSLFRNGKEEILKKAIEEMEEVREASIKEDREALVYEISDLFFHIIVLMNLHRIHPEDIYEELTRRRKEKR